MYRLTCNDSFLINAELFSAFIAISLGRTHMYLFLIFVLGFLEIHQVYQKWT